MITFLLILIFLAILWPRAIKFTLALPLLIGLWSMPSHAETTAKALISIYTDLDGICRTAPDHLTGKLVCKERQVVYEAIDKHNWCYGKIGQISADMRWHKCTKNSQHPTQEDLHAYDY